ncbi:MAG: sigma-54-dependent Fis family transcriptional regulator [Gammaproteobacteria bacterium]|nr:sigma-54-dependent Fis family transcriptional regulator [Gammaproteobacteria bacterium]
MSRETTYIATALIVDDEPDLLELLTLTLRRMQIATVSAETLSEARRSLQSREFQFCLTDMRLPDGNGLELIHEIHNHHPDMPVAMITAHGDMNSAIEALKAGAFDFVNKPVDLQTLRDLVQSALSLNTLSLQEGSATPLPTLLGSSPPMEILRTTIHKLARSQAPVYIRGESGTGKELVARLIHLHGPRRQAPFIPVNCGAIPAELIESELFGHVKGSFTGANSDRQGLFQAAHGGTLFLDEVADLPLNMQVKLLRAIQEKRIRPVGASHEIHIDSRILSATHKDLAQMVKEGEFREDLYFRINVIELAIPPLRDHPEDIPLLAEAIIARLGKTLSIAKPTIKAPALKRLQQYSYPGNIRELENILERALTLCEQGEITCDDIQIGSGVEPHTTEEKSDPEEIGLDDYLAEIEREVLVSTLEKSRFNKTAAAKRLGISFRSIRYRLQRLGIDL